MSKKRINAPQRDVVKTASAIKHPQSLTSFHNRSPIWSFLYCDFEHERWGVASNGEILSEVLARLRDFQGQTWGEILRDTAGRNGNTKNHDIPLTDIIKEAQKRFSDRNLHHNFDSLYSLTVTGRFRLFGILTEEVFHLVWIDANHEICPSIKRHT